MANETIKYCPCCKAAFTLEELATDPDISLIGMAFGDDSIEWAYYFFQHEVEGCRSSFAVKVEDFLSQITEPIPAERMALRDCCEEHCVSVKDLGECKNECYFAPFRRQLLKMLAAKAERAAGNVCHNDVTSPR
jgi:hypothetical protein